MYWILDEFDKEQDIIPSEMEMKGKCYWSIIWQQYKKIYGNDSSCCF